MSDQIVKLPDDSSNTGKNVRTNERVVGSSTVQEHYMIIQSPGSDFQAQVISGPAHQTTGLAVWSMAAGSREVYQATHDNINLNANIQVGNSDVSSSNPMPISGVINIGSVNATVDAVYIQSGANMLGSFGVTNIDNPETIGSHDGRVAGSIVNMPTVTVTSTNLDIRDLTSVSDSVTVANLSTAGSLGIQGISGTVVGVSGIVNQGTSPWVVSGTATVSGIFHDILGSVRVTNQLDILEDSVSAVGSIHTGSATLIGGDWGGSIAVARMDIGSYLLTVGSISSIPIGSVRVTGITSGSVEAYQASAGELNVTVANLSTAGSLETQGVSGTAFNTVWIGVGSTVISGTSQPVARGIGSVLGLFTDSSNNLESPLVDNGSYLMIAGSITSMPSVTTSVSNIYKMSGNTVLPGSLALVGGWFNGSAYPLHIETGSSLLTVGSTHIANFGEIGSAETQGVSGTAFNTVWVNTGSVVISGTSIPPSRGVGSVVISGTSIPVFRGIGSVHLVPGSIEVYQTTASDLQISGVITVEKWLEVGSVVISGTSIPPMRGVGSVVISGTSIPVSRGTGSVVISGTTMPPLRGETTVRQARGIYDYSGHTFIGSFTGSYLITPGAGSSILLRGFTASAELASKFKLQFSGAHGDEILISTFNLPNSGTVAMNFLGMEPSGAADLPIGIGKADTGSLHITFFTADTL